MEFVLFGDVEHIHVWNNTLLLYTRVTSESVDLTSYVISIALSLFAVPSIETTDHHSRNCTRRKDVQTHGPVGSLT
jgi:hypothetical protein